MSAHPAHVVADDADRPAPDRHDDVRLKPWGDTCTTRWMQYTIEEQTDASSDVGAARIAATIRDFWRKRGGIVTTRTEHFTHGINQRQLACVRSDMVNGLPADRRRT